MQRKSQIKNDQGEKDSAIGPNRREIFSGDKKWFLGGMWVPHPWPVGARTTLRVKASQSTADTSANATILDAIRVSFCEKIKKYRPFSGLKDRQRVATNFRLSVSKNLTKIWKKLTSKVTKLVKINLTRLQKNQTTIYRKNLTKNETIILTNMPEIRRTYAVQNVNKITRGCENCKNSGVKLKAFQESEISEHILASQAQKEASLAQGEGLEQIGKISKTCKQLGRLQVSGRLLIENIHNICLNLNSAVYFLALWPFPRLAKQNQLRLSSTSMLMISSQRTMVLENQRIMNSRSSYFWLSNGAQRTYQMELPTTSMRSPLEGARWSCI